MARFLLKESRYIRAAGQAEPAYVYADPDHPVVIALAEDHRPDGRLVPVPDETPLGSWVGPPPALVPAHADQTREPVPSSARVQGPVGAAPPTKRRVADG